MHKHIQLERSEQLHNSIFETLKAYQFDMLEVTSHPKAEGQPI